MTEVLVKTYIPIIAPHKRHNDDALVSALVLVNSVHLHCTEPRACQPGRDRPHLLPVRSDYPNIGRFASSLRKKSRPRFIVLTVTNSQQADKHFVWSLMLYTRYN